MTRRSRFPVTGLLLSLFALLLVVPFLGTAAQADPTDPADPGGQGGAAATSPQEVAEEALASVEEIIEGSAPAPVDPTDPGVPAQQGERVDLTLALRDLAAAKDDLPTGKQDDAARLLARPDDSGQGCDVFACWSPSANEGRRCDTRVCVHWTRNTADRATDAYVLRTLDTVNRIAERYKSAGFRVPVNDRGAGGNWKLDVYLADLGDVGVYGYCNTDQDIDTHTPAPAYCVLDNDYAPSQYGSANTPTELLKVTAAHEFFHAVQFAYDVLEDRWFMEATATWVEDEIYDSVNDNRNYLGLGPMGTPHRSLDTVNGGAEYGAWIFFRFLTEKYGYSQAGIPVLVRKMWEAAAHTGPGAQGLYSVEAIRSALAERNTFISTEFSSFVARNRQPARHYDEGSAYPVAGPRGPYTLTAGAPAKNLGFRLDHLAAKTLRYYPANAMSQVWNLRIDLDLNSREAGGSAIVTIKPTGKAARLQRVSLDADGNAVLTVPFGSRVDWIEVSVVNASPRYNCTGEQDHTMVCRGVPIDDNQLQVLDVRAFV